MCRETAACPLPFALGDDPPLDPVVATTFEAGTQLVRGPVILNASVYRTNVRDDISFIQSETAVFEGFFANIGNTRRQGIELGVQLVPSEKISLYANYAFTRATFQDPAEIFSIRADDQFAGAPLAGPNDVGLGDRLPLVPDHQIKAGGLLTLPAGLQLGLDGRYTGKQWLRGDEANETAPLDGYFVGNVRLGWDYAKMEHLCRSLECVQLTPPGLRHLQRESPDRRAGALPHSPECSRPQSDCTSNVRR